MSKLLNRGVSTALAIGIIAVLAVVFLISLIAYEYYIQQKDNIIEEETADFSSLDKDELLGKLFPNLSFENGTADLSDKIDYPLNLYLKDSIEDYFIDSSQKNLLLVANLDGVAHAGGLYHAYLGLFDKDGNLLTPSSPFPSVNYDNPYGDDYYDFFLDEAQFSADEGGFGFYDCKGIKYILFISHGCPNGTCCNGGARLFRINNGAFEDVQTIDNDSLVEINNGVLSKVIPFTDAAASDSYAFRLTLSDDKILVKRVPTISNTGCPESNYKELKWNKDSCMFE
ncbi:MAG: hypothetical protein PHI53_00475 [Candidatus Pacebacteria bacterium]|nr:hypothetical protein [Candidatus Paceibacterota bacterium]